MKKSHLKALNTVVRIRSKIDHLNVYIYGGGYDGLKPFQC